MGPNSLIIIFIIRPDDDEGVWPHQMLGLFNIKDCICTRLLTQYFFLHF